jgi:hypothetical protein
MHTIKTPQPLCAIMDWARARPRSKAEARRRVPSAGDAAIKKKKNIKNNSKLKVHLGF